MTLTVEEDKLDYYWLQIAEREARWLDPCESAIPAPFARRFWSKSMNMPKELSRYLHLNPVRAENVQEKPKKKIDAMEKRFPTVNNEDLTPIFL